MNEAEKNQALAEASVDTQEILKKYDKESDYRSYSGLMAKVVAAIAITFSCFQLYTAIFGVLDAMIQRSIHLSFGMALVFLLYPTSKKWPKNKLHPLDLALSVLGAITPMYIIANYGELVKRAGTATTPDMIVGVIGILLVLEAARRIVGLPIVIIASTFIVYAFVGPYLPGQLAHRGVDVGDLVQHLYYTTEGVFGIPLGVSSTFIFLFILFGSFLEKTGLGQYFIDLANSIAGRASGGPAKVAVLSSGLMGTVSGSSVANVVGTGSFTIPMMKRLGYSPEFAGAVEATASTGGQLMPPIMGAAAFLMAEMTNIPYVRIIGAAVIPALLYYFGVWAGVHFEAKKLGLRGMTKEELPNLKEIFFGRGYLMLPLIGIVWLLVTGYTPMLAAFYAIVLSIAAAVLGWWAPLPIGGMIVLFAVMKPIFHVGEFGADGAVKYLTEMTPLGAMAVLAIVLLGFAILKKKPNLGVKEIVGGLESGARGAIGVLAATACAGIIIGVVTKTGLGLKLGAVLVDIAQGNLILTLIFTMITSIILGMGIPTTANYIITSTIAAPAIIMILRQKFPDLPVDAVSIILPAHMFAFYFGIIADVTPPVALAAFAGAGIAKANPMKTGFQASKLAVAAFLVPYIFVMNPMMLMIDVTLWAGILMVVTSMIGIIGVSSGIMGFLICRSLWWERIIMSAGGVLLVYPGAVTDLIGIGMIGAGVVSQILRVNFAKKSA
jgi:TRAP transporter 4TM/12TM fusion protein